MIQPQNELTHMELVSHPIRCNLSTQEVCVICRMIHRFLCYLLTRCRCSSSPFLSAAIPAIQWVCMACFPGKSDRHGWVQV